MTLASHQFAELFPLIEGVAFADLIADIRDHGLRERIVLLDRQIVDGRNRYRVLQHLVESGEVLGDGWGDRAGEPLHSSALLPPQNWFAAYNPARDGDPLAWVISKNLKRRHLDESQRAMVGAKLANISNGGDRRSDQSANLRTEKVSQAEAARLLNVSERAVTSAKAVADRGAPALQHAVEQGTVAVSTAEALTSLPQGEQAEIVAKGEREILAAAKEIRSRKRETRFAEVSEKLARISESSTDLPTGRKWGILYADPATRYVSGFGDRSIENHYPTMTIDELCALPVGDIALSSSVLFCWSTIPQLRNTMRMIEAWGFEYVSAWCWDKQVHGTGHWGFNQHEELLIATRGSFPAPIPGQQPRSIYSERKGEHSEKPLWFAQQIERLWPQIPKIELFARVDVAHPLDWAVWGNQSGAPPCATPAASIAAPQTVSTDAAAIIASIADAGTPGTTIATSATDPKTISTSLSDWTDRALKWIGDYAASHDTFIGEECTDAAAEAGLPAPPNSKAWGAPFRIAAKDGVIERAGTGISKRPHRSSTPLWRAGCPQADCQPEQPSQQPTTMEAQP